MMFRNACFMAPQVRATPRAIRWIARLAVIVSIAGGAGTATAQPSPSNSTGPERIGVNASGSICFDVLVRDASNNPLAGNLVECDFSCAVSYCASQPPGVTISGSTARAVTNALGLAHFCICATVPGACIATISDGGISLFEAVVDTSAVLGGVPHEPLGAATLTQDALGLRVSNLGSSGVDGISVPIGDQGSGLCTGLGNPEAGGGLPTGATLRYAMIGRFDGMASDDTIGTLVATRLSGGAIQLSVTGAAYAAGYEITAWHGDTLLATVSDVTSGGIGIANLWPYWIESQSGKECRPFSGRKQVARKANKGWAYIGFGPPDIPFGGGATVTLEGGGNVFANALRVDPISENGPELLDISKIRLTTMQIPSLRIGGAMQYAFGHQHEAIGQPRFEAAVSGFAVEPGLENNPYGFEVHFCPSDGYSIHLASLDPGGTAALGAYVEVAARGSFNGVIRQPLGGARVTKTDLSGNPLSVTADFSDVGSTTQRIQIVQNGSVLVDATGHTGEVARLAAWPDWLRKRKNAIQHTKCIWMDVPPGTDILFDGNHYAADQLRILVEGETGTIDHISDLSVTASGLPNLTVIEEVGQEIAVVPAGSALRWMVLAVMLAGGGIPVLRGSRGRRTRSEPRI